MYGEVVINHNIEYLRLVHGYGVSKEHRKSPIVQMGLFMDEQGTPISISMFPGNTLDHQTVKRSLEESLENLNVGRYIFVGDRGVYNIAYMKENNKLSKTPENLWSMGLSSERIINALKEWQVAVHSEQRYRFYNIEHPDLKLILDAFNIDIKRKLYNKSELKNIKTSIIVSNKKETETDQ